MGLRLLRFKQDSTETMGFVLWAGKWEQGPPSGHSYIFVHFSNESGVQFYKYHDILFTQYPDALGNI
jgi:hypothetical protein